MGLFDFLKKKPTEEEKAQTVRIPNQEVAQKVEQESSQNNVQDPPFVKDMRHFQNGPWHQYDVLIDARIYGWNQMVEWADYVAKADFHDVGEVTIGDVGTVSKNLTAEYKAAGSIAGMKTLANEGGVLSAAGFSKVLEAPIKIVWFNQTNILRFFTPSGDAISIVKYAETVIRRLFNTPDAMKIYNQAIKGEIMPTPERVGQAQADQEDEEVITAEYDAELRGFVSIMTAEQKKEVLECINQNNKIMAVKVCREAMRSGLKQARDVVVHYETYLK